MHKIKGYGKITEENINDMMREIRLSLLEADVNYKVVKEFTNTVKEKALGQNVLTALKPKELMLKIVYDELTILMGGEAVPLNLSGNPTVILMSGLQGSGKTTLSGKLALKLKSEKAKQRGFGDYCWKLYNLEVKKAKPCLLDTFKPNKK